MKTQQWRPSARLQKRSVPPLSIIDVSGVAALMVFLAMFILADSYHGWYSSAVDRVSASHSTFQPGAVKEDALVIHLTRDRKIYFGSNKVTPEQITELIRAAVQQGSEPKVYLGVDAQAKYWDVKILLDQIRLGKIENVVLLRN
jgi:biopolymer transport protein ExbD